MNKDKNKKPVKNENKPFMDKTINTIKFIPIFFPIIVILGLIYVAITPLSSLYNFKNSEKIYNRMERIAKTIHSVKTKDKTIETGYVISSQNNNTVTKDGIGKLILQLNDKNKTIIHYDVNSDYALKTDKASEYNNVNISKKTFKNLQDGEKIKIVESNYKLKGDVANFENTMDATQGKYNILNQAYMHKENGDVSLEYDSAGNLNEYDRGAIFQAYNLVTYGADYNKPDDVKLVIDNN